MPASAASTPPRACSRGGVDAAVLGGVRNALRWDDGRSAGGTTSQRIGRAAPEGTGVDPVPRVRDGDLIRVDIAARTPDAHFGETELESGCSTMEPTPPVGARRGRREQSTSDRLAPDVRSTGPLSPGGAHRPSAPVPVGRATAIQIQEVPYVI
ncbi:MAG: hypothetical protein ACTHZX_05335 [Microbacterium sp.]